MLPLRSDRHGYFLLFILLVYLDLKSYVLYRVGVLCFIFPFKMQLLGEKVQMLKYLLPQKKQIFFLLVNLNTVAL